jgi:hypothetical protein
MDALEQMQGMPPGMYHRYGVLDDMEDEEDDSTEHIGEYNSSGVYSTDMLVADMAGLGVNDSSEAGERSSTSVEAAAGVQGLEEGDGQGAADQGVAVISSWSLQVWAVRLQVSDAGAAWPSTTCLPQGHCRLARC